MPTDADLQNKVPLNWAYPVHIRAHSFSEPPNLKDLQPLDQDAYRLAYWKAVSDLSEASDEKSVAIFRLLKTACPCMKVVFQYCSSDEHAEKRKWRLSNQDQVAAGNATLRGWKRIQGITLIAKQLSAWSLDASAEAVSKWLAAEKIPVSAKVIRSMQNVQSRVQAASLELLLDEMEDISGVDHCLSKLSNLEQICSMTKVEKNPGLQSSLLQFVAEDIKRATAAKILSPDVNRDSVGQLAKGSLLARRIIFYLTSKLKAPATSGPSQPGAAELEASSRTPASVFQNFTSHSRLDASGLCSGTSDLTWCSSLLPFQHQAISIFKQLLMPNILTKEALMKSVEKDPMVSAEEVLQQPHWQELIPLAALMNAREQDLVQHGLLPNPLPQQAAEPPKEPTPGVATPDEATPAPEAAMVAKVNDVCSLKDTIIYMHVYFCTRACSLLFKTVVARRTWNQASHRLKMLQMSQRSQDQLHFRISIWINGWLMF